MNFFVGQFDEEILVEAHEHSRNHRSELLDSQQCGCFYCGKTYPPDDIQEWVRNNTALCPECGIDSVLGSASGYELTEEFLRAMYDYWFGQTIPASELTDSDTETASDD